MSDRTDRPQETTPWDKPATLGYAGPRLGGEDGLPTLGQRGFDALSGMRGWLLFFAVLLYISIGLSGLGLVGLVIAGVAGIGSGQGGTGGGVFLLVMACFYAVPLVLMFFPALFLTRSAGAIARLRQSSSGQDLDDALVHMKAYWKFLGLVIVIGFALYLLLLIAALVLGVAAAGAGSPGGTGGAGGPF